MESRHVKRKEKDKVEQTYSYFIREEILKSASLDGARTLEKSEILPTISESRFGKKRIVIQHISSSKSSDLFALGSHTSSETSSSISLEAGVNIVSRDGNHFVSTGVNFPLNVFCDQASQIWYGKTITTLGCFAKNLTTAAELAALGGMLFYKLIEGQPRFQLAYRQQAEKALEPFVICEELKLVSEGIDIFNQDRPIKNFMDVIVMSLFLGDSDISNIGAIADKELLHIIRFDTEKCFSEYYLPQYSHEVVIENELRFLYLFDDEYVAAIRKRREEGSLFKSTDIPPYFLNCLQHDIFKNQKALQILTSPQAKRELFIALSKILDISLDEYISLIDSSLTSDMEVREKIKEGFVQRLARFKNASLKIPGFLEYYQEHRSQLTVMSPFKL